MAAKIIGALLFIFVAGTTLFVFYRVGLHWYSSLAARKQGFALLERLEENPEGTPGNNQNNLPLLDPKK